jgi:hypothetical protein
MRPSSLPIRALVTAGAILASALSQAQIGFEIKPSLAPNAFGSTYWNIYVENAVHALFFGLDEHGDFGTPGLYQALPTNEVLARHMCVTSFPSWLGLINPGAAFGASYATEYGNRLHFGVRITGNGRKISISMLTFEATSNDSDNLLGFGFGLGEYGYSPSYVGVDYGVDGVRGTTDDVFITGGANTQLVDEIVGRGSGNAFWPGEGEPTYSQATIDDYIAALPKKMTFKAKYRLIENGTVIGTGTYTMRIIR